MDSVTGREIPHLTLTHTDRGRLWSSLYPLFALLPALTHRRWFAAGFWLVAIAGLMVITRFGQPIARRTTRQKVFFALLCAIELRQYLLLFVDYPLYELVSEGLLRALKILKNPGEP